MLLFALMMLSVALALSVWMRGKWLDAFVYDDRYAKRMRIRARAAKWRAVLLMLGLPLLVAATATGIIDGFKVVHFDRPYQLSGSATGCGLTVINPTTVPAYCGGSDVTKDNAQPICAAAACNNKDEMDARDVVPNAVYCITAPDAGTKVFYQVLSQCK